MDIRDQPLLEVSTSTESSSWISILTAWLPYRPWRRHRCNDDQPIGHLLVMLFVEYAVHSKITMSTTHRGFQIRRPSGSPFLIITSDSSLIRSSSVPFDSVLAIPFHGFVPFHFGFCSFHSGFTFRFHSSIHSIPFHSSIPFHPLDDFVPSSRFVHPTYGAELLPIRRNSSSTRSKRSSVCFDQQTLSVKRRRIRSHNSLSLQTNVAVLFPIRSRRSLTLIIPHPKSKKSQSLLSHKLPLPLGKAEMRIKKIIRFFHPLILSSP